MMIQRIPIGLHVLVLHVFASGTAVEWFLRGRLVVAFELA